MKKMLSALGALIICGSGVGGVVSCGNDTSAKINDFKWPASNLVVDDSQHKIMSSILPSRKVQINSFTLDEIESEYTSYVENWYQLNNIKDALNVTMIADGQSQIDIKSKGSNTDALVMGIVDSQRSVDAMIATLQSQRWSDMITSKTDQAKYTQLHYFYLQTPKAKAQYDVTGKNIVAINLNIYSLIASHDGEKILVNKAETGSKTFDFKI